MKKFTLGMDIGIDLGSSSIKIYTPGKGIAVREPTLVALDRDTDEILALGSEAFQMLGRTPEKIAVVRPIQYGRIRNFKLAEAILVTLLREVCGNRIIMPRVVVCIPSGVSDVEKSEVVETLRAAGARKVCLIETVVAAALGAGLDISEPRGCMICDIGGGTTDIGVISVNGTAISNWIKCAGNSFDQALTDYVRETRKLIIGPRTAELLKRELGCVIPRETSFSATVRGRHAETGMPAMADITSDEMLEAFEEPAIRICRAVQRTLEETPPALAGDLITNGGITLTGGGAGMYGMDRLIAERTGLNVTVADESSLCVAYGTGKAIRFLSTNNQLEISTSPLDVYGY